MKILQQDVRDTASALRVRDAVAEQLAYDLEEAHAIIREKTKNFEQLLALYRAVYSGLIVTIRERDRAVEDKRRLQAELSDVYARVLSRERLSATTNLEARITHRTRQRREVQSRLNFPTRPEVSATTNLPSRVTAEATL